MSSDYDAADFVDGDFPPKPGGSAAAAAGAGLNRAPTRAEVDARVGEAQQKIAELKRAQEELERERASLEETRRRQIEFQTGREEVISQIVRAVGLLQEAEVAARRDAEQMAKSLGDLQHALDKVQATRADNWTRENFNAELTRGLTAVEAARMEWNSARQKFALLSGNLPGALANPAPPPPRDLFADRSFWDWCKLGLALNGPLVVVALLAFAIVMAVLTGRR